LFGSSVTFLISRTVNALDLPCPLAKPRNPQGWIYMQILAIFREEDLRNVDPVRFKHLAELHVKV